MPPSTLHNAFNYLTENILFYSSALLAQTYSIFVSGTGKFKAALLALKTSFFTRITAIFYTPPSMVVLPLPPEKRELLPEQGTIYKPPTLLDLPPKLLQIITKKLEPHDELALLSTCSALRNQYSSDQRKWIAFEKSYTPYLNYPYANTLPLLVKGYRETLLYLLNPQMSDTDLKRISLFAERFHEMLPYAKIKKVLKQVLQQPTLDIPQQWEKLASVNLHLCVTLSGIATMKKLAEYGVDRHFFSGHFSTGNTQIEALLNRIKKTESYKALDCAMKENLKEIAIELITHLSTSDLYIADILINATGTGDSATLNLLLKNNINLNLQDRNGLTALMAASREGQLGTVQLLLGHGANVNLQDKEGKTALMGAAGRGRQEAVQLLLKYGANINLQDKQKRTALTYACLHHNATLIELFLQQGANITSGTISVVEDIISKTLFVGVNHPIPPLFNKILATQET